jgi:outer membrane biogenesis lipoprotein LolB
MRQSTIKRSLLALAAAALFGCAHKAVVESPVQPLEPSDFWRDQTARRALLGGFSAKLKMSYEGRKQSVSGKGRLVGNYPRSFRLELRDPLGRLHFVLTQKGTSVVAHYPRNKQAIRDNTAGKAYFKRLLGVATPFTDWVALFAGVLPAKWEKVRFSRWEWDRDQGAFRGDLAISGEKLTVWIDSANTAIQSLVWEAGEERIEAQYTDREPCCENKAMFTLGYEANVRMPRQKTSVAVTWETLTKPSQEIPATAYEFQPGAGDKVLDLK